MLKLGHKLFRVIWRSANLALLLSILAVVYCAGWEYSVRRYLDGFSDAIIPADAAPEKKVQAILDWMRKGPLRSEEPSPTGLAVRDPENTLNYRQLLTVCGTATNAFLNLARSSDLQARRLLLLTPDRITKHVVAEVSLNGRWIVVDPTYRAIMKNASGEMLTREDLKNPLLFAEATATIPDYPAEYNYINAVHVRLARLPMLKRLQVRSLMDRVIPGWEEKVDWSLLLERESFFSLSLASLSAILLLFLRAGLAWLADRRLSIPRFRLRSHLLHAGAALFTTPEMK